MATAPMVMIRATTATSKLRAIATAPVPAPLIVRATSKETMMLAIANSATAPTTRRRAPISVTTAFAIRVEGGREFAADRLTGRPPFGAALPFADRVEDR